MSTGQPYILLLAKNLIFLSMMLTASAIINVAGNDTLLFSEFNIVSNSLYNLLKTCDFTCGLFTKF